MQIPVNEAIGFPTVSVNQLRIYGAGGFRLLEQEEARGCPRQYKARYVEKRVPKESGVYALDYGNMVHEALYTMEEDGVGPEEALDRVFPAHMDPEAYQEALHDLRAYVERGASPMDRFLTIAVENDLSAELYVDDDFGPIWFRGIIDWIGMDSEVPTLLHGVDYKTNRHPPSLADVRGDVQLKAYHWLIAQHLREWMPSGGRIVMHLDAIKFREVQVGFSNEDIEDWHSWAVAVVRAMLRDDKGEPVLNPGCAWCPVKDDCPAFAELPSVGKEIAAAKPSDGGSDVARLEWRDAANATRLLLKKAVEEIDSRFKDRASITGRLVVGDDEYVRVPDWKDEIDLPALHEAMGDSFYEVITAGKGKIEAVTSDWTPDRLAGVKQAVRRVPQGTKIDRRKVES